MSKSRRSSRRRRKQKTLADYWPYIGAAVGLLAVAIIVVLALSNRNKEASAAVQVIEDLGNSHLSSEPANYIWNSRPPTSGPHSDNIAPWGIHEQTIPEWNQVHNLEDGGVILHYNCPEGCPDLVEDLEDIVGAVGRDRLLLHPYTNMDSRIAVTAWTRLLELDEFDRDEIVGFIETYRGIDHH